MPLYPLLAHDRQWYPELVFLVTVVLQNSTVLVVLVPNTSCFISHVP